MTFLKCVFCEKIHTQGKVDSAVIYYVDTNVYRIKPLNPVTNGHLLFVPKDHCDGSRKDANHIGRALQAAYDYGYEEGVDFNIILNMGSDASQTVEHTHIHYVPRRPGDGLKLPWTGQTKNKV